MFSKFNFNKYRAKLNAAGFSMLEAVVVVGVLLALAVAGFIAYGNITENAKRASVESAAASIYTAIEVAKADGDPNTTPQKVVDEWNASNSGITAKIPVGS